MKNYLVLIFMVWLSVVYAQDITDKSLYVYYPFNGNGLDQSGHGNNAKVEGAQLATDRFGNKNSCYQLIGDGDNISFGNSINLWEADWTYSIWIKLDVLPTVVDDAFLLSYKSIGYGEDVHLYVDNLDNKVKAFLNDGNEKVSTNAIIEKDKWYQIIITYSQSLLSIYINGEFKVASSSGFSDSYENSDLMISSIYNDDALKGRIFGSVDDVRLYNRVLSQDEVDSLYVLESTENTPTNTSNLKGNNILSISPNPAYDRVYVESDQTIQQVEICTLNGQIISSFPVTNPHSVKCDLNSFSSGMYVLKIATTENRVSYRRVVVTK
ncbi:LamG-like jellyroll fold domain-containing protein [Saccharicrinis sp. FJH54]|uniref:LamG-like jellyroll fold domain-containing protein n=1 Tax=Saccharicrinis sp. FJH54 TaxID=3344665 RepID=UPI0035D47D2C